MRRPSALLAWMTLGACGLVASPDQRPAFAADPPPAAAAPALPTGRTPLDRGTPDSALDPPRIARPVGPDPAPLPPADQGVPRIRAPVAGPTADAFDPSTWDPRTPPLGHPIRGRGRITLETDKAVFGQVGTFDGSDGTRAYVMVGNPVIRGEDFVVKAESIVAWIDESKAGGLGFDGILPGEKGEGGGGGGRLTAAPSRAPAPSGGAVSVLPEALVAIYAVGAVDLTTGDIAFRASELYLNARQNRALLIEPRLDTTTAVGAGASTDPTQKAVPVHVRARTFRTLTEGFAVFERGDVATSRANDRVALEVAVLTMEEFAQASAGKPTVLGFHTAGSQRYTGRSIVGRAERVPLFLIPQASFGGSGLSEFPVRVRQVTTGSRSSLGRYALVGVGARRELGRDAFVDWTAVLGGYTKRGFAAGGELAWKELDADRARAPRVAGRLEMFGLNDRSGEDRDGYRAGEGLRGKLEAENRWEATRSLRLDTELALFSDRGFNREFFESDERTHKDRETYARLRWLEGGTAATLTAGLHVRDFRTETVEQPALALWSESLPLGETTGPLRLAFDLSSAATVGRLVRRIDEDLGREGYEALRADVRERVYAPFDVGDVRISPFVGLAWSGWFERTDGGDDLANTALETGVRANLELHRDFALAGGPWRLDGLRHVVELDVGAYARGFSAYDRGDPPVFDRVEVVEDRTDLFVEVRNRFETRRVTGDRFVGREARNATIADLRVRGAFWPGEVGPYGRRGPGEIETWGMAEITPDSTWIRGESAIELGDATLRHASIGVQYAPSDELSVATGMRFVRNEIFAPWFEVFDRWNEKWGTRISGIRDFDSRAGANLKLSILRFSDDHLIELGASIRDDGRDAGVFVSFHPAIGGTPLSSPFDPRESIDFTP